MCCLLLVVEHCLLVVGSRSLFVVCSLFACGLYVLLLVDVCGSSFVRFFVVCCLLMFVVCCLMLFNVVVGHCRLFVARCCLLCVLCCLLDVDVCRL